MEGYLVILQNWSPRFSLQQLLRPQSGPYLHPEAFSYVWSLAATKHRASWTQWPVGLFTPGAIAEATVVLSAGPTPSAGNSHTTPPCRGAIRLLWLSWRCDLIIHLQDPLRKEGTMVALRSSGLQSLKQRSLWSCTGVEEADTGPWDSGLRRGSTSSERWTELLATVCTLYYSVHSNPTASVSL